MVATVEGLQQEVASLRAELKASQEYAQICEDEGVELRRQVHELTKQMKKMQKAAAAVASAPASSALVARTPARATAPARTPARSNAPARTPVRDTTQDVTGTNQDATEDVEESPPRRTTRSRAARGASAGAQGGQKKRKAEEAANKKKGKEPEPVVSKPSATKKSRASATGAACSGTGKIPEEEVESAAPVEIDAPMAVDAPAEAAPRPYTPVRRAPPVLDFSEEHELPQEGPPKEVWLPASAEELLAKIRGNSGVWTDRIRALEIAAELLTGTGEARVSFGVPSDRCAFLAALAPCLAVQVSDMRSKLVIVACLALSSIAAALPAEMAFAAPILLPALLKLAYVKILPIRQPGAECLTVVVRSLGARAVMPVLKAASADVHPEARAAVARCCALLLTPPEGKNRRVSKASATLLAPEDEETLAGLIVTALADSAADPRKEAKAAYAALALSAPSRAAALLAALPPALAKHLLPAAAGAEEAPAAVGKEAEKAGGGKGAGAGRVDVRAAIRAQQLQALKDGARAKTAAGDADLLVKGAPQELAAAAGKENTPLQ